MDSGRLEYALRINLVNPFQPFEHKFFPSFEEVEQRVEFNNDLLLAVCQKDWENHADENRAAGIPCPNSLDDLTNMRS